MLQLSQISPEFLARVRESAGGFAWWYVDVTTDAGDALVLIWSEGLPFLAGSRDARPPGERGAVSLGLYRHGQAEFYLLEEAPLRVDDVDGNARAGSSQFKVRRTDSELVVEADLDLAIPGSHERLVGSVRLRGAPFDPTLSGLTSEHSWTPRLLAATAEVELSMGQRRWILRGNGYFDGNASTLPLTHQGIDAWYWGRVAFGSDRTLVYYDWTLAGETDSNSAPERRTWLIDASPEGAQVDDEARVHFSSFRRTLYGVRAPREIVLESARGRVRCRAVALVDDGPFYQRFLIEAEDEHGETGHGTYEVVKTTAIDLKWQRPFVRMRTHRPGASNSIWLPLFTGPRPGRASRLIFSWFSSPSSLASGEP